MALFKQNVEAEINENKDRNVEVDSQTIFFKM